MIPQTCKEKNLVRHQIITLHGPFDNLSRIAVITFYFLLTCVKETSSEVKGVYGQKTNSLMYLFILTTTYIHKKIRAITKSFTIRVYHSGREKSHAHFMSMVPG